MENCIKRLPAKSFNTCGLLLLAILLAFAVIITGVSASFFFHTSFHCYHETISDERSLTTYVNIKCFNKYEKEFRTHLTFGRLMSNFGVVFALSIIYGCLVKHRVEKFDHPIKTATTNEQDDEDKALVTSPHPGQTQRNVRECCGHFSTFSLYIIHLSARVLQSFIFAAVFFLSDIPESFRCPWNNNTKPTLTLNSDDNSTDDNFIIICTNRQSNGSKSLTEYMAWMNVVVLILTFLELGYIAWSVKNDPDFVTEEEFCTVYLLRKRKRSRKMLNKFRERFNPPRDNHWNVVIHKEEERPSDFFKPEINDKNQKYPRSILVKGRSGIGKTFLTRKILYDWMIKEDEFWRDKIVILLEFRAFTKKTITLREMVSHGLGVSSNDFETAYETILSFPTKTVLIFDGLDELYVDLRLLDENSESVIDLNKKMPVFSIFKMLVDNDLLPGVTVLTTSQPTAQHVYRKLNFDKTVEIWGFSEGQIKEYVCKFSEDYQDTDRLIWNQIQKSVELLSLCYVPVNSFIVCLTWQQKIEKCSPKTVTELYKGAVEHFICELSPIDRMRPRPSNKFIFPFPQEMQSDFLKLKNVAKCKMEEGKSIFEQTTKDDFGNLVNCGLFHTIQGSRKNYFSFLHCTFQEFLVASNMVDDDIDNVVKFLDDHDHIKNPKWHLVIQFLTGLLGERIKANRNEEKLEKILEEVQKRLKEWAFLLGAKAAHERNIALLAIQCIHELQDSDTLKSICSNFLAKEDGNGELHLEKLSITPVNSAALFDFLSYSNNLKRLTFRHCTIHGDSYSKMEKSLLNNPTNSITSLTWYQNFSDQGVKHVSEALKNQNCKLLELELAQNSAITREGANYLGEALKDENCGLLTLDLAGNAITAAGVLCLSRALNSHNCKLTSLNLAKNGITAEGVKHLIEAWKLKNCKLKHLSLACNEIKDDGVRYLSEALKSKNCKLVSLNLIENEITEQGVEYLCEALEHKNHKLTSLELRDSGLTNQSVERLRKYLKC